VSAIPRKINFGMSPKYHNKPTQVVEGPNLLKFASQKEAKCYADLKILERAGRIRNIQRQVPFRVEVGGKLVCKYVADFVFDEYAHNVWTQVVADAKGYPTPVYRLKRKLMLIVLGIEIREM
jgi:hypothetical protein